VLAKASSDACCCRDHAHAERMGVRIFRGGLVIPTGIPQLDAFSIYITLGGRVHRRRRPYTLSIGDLLVVDRRCRCTSKGAHGVPGSGPNFFFPCDLGSDLNAGAEHSGNRARAGAVGFDWSSAWRPRARQSDRQWCRPPIVVAALGGRSDRAKAVQVHGCGVRAGGCNAVVGGPLRRRLRRH